MTEIHMYYEPNPKKKRGAASPKRRGCLPTLCKWVLLILVLYAGFTLISGQLVSLNLPGGTPSDLGVNASLPGGYTNILLLGCDAGEDGGNGRNDSTIVASIGASGEIKLCSLMRDTMVDMGERGAHKLNAAYRFGGGELAMRAVNQTFGLNITKYAAIDFQGFAKVIDSMGGIELTITKAEMNEINDGLKNAYKKKRVFNGVLMEPLTEYGEDIHMSGTHALFYSRIRSIDSDFRRAERQRIVIDTMVRRIRKIRNPVTLARLCAAFLECATTNMSLVELSALGMRALTASGEMKQSRMPPEGAYKQTVEDGVWMIRPNLEKCRQAMYKFIYED